MLDICYDFHLGRCIALDRDGHQLATLILYLRLFVLDKAIDGRGICSNLIVELDSWCCTKLSLKLRDRLTYVDKGYEMSVAS